MAQVLERLEPTMPKAAKMLRGAEPDTLAYLSLPEGAPQFRQRHRAGLRRGGLPSQGRGNLP